MQSVLCEFFQGVAEGRFDVPEGEEIWKRLRVMTLNKIRGVGDFHRAVERVLQKFSQSLDAQIRESA